MEDVSFFNNRETVINSIDNEIENIDSIKTLENQSKKIEDLLGRLDKVCQNQLSNLDKKNVRFIPKLVQKTLQKSERETITSTLDRINELRDALNSKKISTVLSELKRHLEDKVDKKAMESTEPKISLEVNLDEEINSITKDNLIGGVLENTKDNRNTLKYQIQGGNFSILSGGNLRVTGDNKYKEENIEKAREAAKKQEKTRKLIYGIDDIIKTCKTRPFLKSIDYSIPPGDATLFRAELGKRGISILSERRDWDKLKFTIKNDHFNQEKLDELINSNPDHYISDEKILNSIDPKFSLNIDTFIFYKGPQITDETEFYWNTDHRNDERDINKQTINDFISSYLEPFGFNISCIKLTIEMRYRGFDEALAALKTISEEKKGVFETVYNKLNQFIESVSDFLENSDAIKEIIEKVKEGNVVGRSFSDIQPNPLIKNWFTAKGIYFGVGSRTFFCTEEGLKKLKNRERELYGFPLNPEEKPEPKDDVISTPILSYIKTLGFDAMPGGSDDEIFETIKKSYLKLAAKKHPDKKQMEYLRSIGKLLGEELTEEEKSAYNETTKKAEADFKAVSSAFDEISKYYGKK